MHKKTRYGGFTLIELMVTVAIVAILARIAYPAYTNYLTRGKRSSAESFMATLANKEEQSLLNARCYFNYPTDAACTPPVVTVPGEVSGNYAITVTATNTAGAPPTYTVTATPNATQLANDQKCQSLTLTNTGTKGVTGPDSVSNCWR